MRAVSDCSGVLPDDAVQNLEERRLSSDSKMDTWSKRVYDYYYGTENC